MYDVVPVIAGVAADLSHMDSDCKVTGYCDPLGSNSTEQLDAALKGMQGPSIQSHNITVSKLRSRGPECCAPCCRL